MPKVIIGIHGLANKPAEETLKEWWQSAMLEGLEVNQANTTANLNFLSVYWADMMYDAPDATPDAYRKANPSDLAAYKESWLERLKNSTTGQIGNALDVVKQSLGINEIAELTIDQKMQDLAQYYKNANLRADLRGRLKTVINEHRDKEIMLVAHSMGSIIAYDVLRELHREGVETSIGHLITIGSPLGLSHVKLKIAEENSSVQTPENVKQWTNFADRFDPVALDPKLGDDYANNAEGVKVKDDMVLNDWGGIHHKSYGYLRTPEFSEQLNQFI